jgi:hypothetical protein
MFTYVAMRTRAGRSRLLGATVTFALVAALAVSASGSAVAEQPQAQQRVPSAVPTATTPGVDDGAVHAFAQVGSTMVAGGDFGTVSPPGSTATLHRGNVFAFSVATGAIAKFAPRVNGEVDTLAAGPTAGSVYLGGSFTTVNGHATGGLALVNLSTGYLVPSFHIPALNGPVTDIVRVGGRLYVSGYFTTVAGRAHRGLVELGAARGTVGTYLQLQVFGHHNFGVHCHKGPSCANGKVGVKAFSISPDHTELVAIGNFRFARSRPGVSSSRHDQIVRVRLERATAVVDASWATPVFESACTMRSFDSWVRDVSFAPDGSYFAVSTTGGRHTGQYCDAVLRFNTATSGRNVRPAWVDFSGGDSIWTLAVTTAAVYVGGHQRWMNNYFGRNNAGAGAVPRPGVAALSPRTGLPLAWNPGRNPRGEGTRALLATPSGIWIGSDTTHIGPPGSVYVRPRIAFFPLAGGSEPHPGKVGALPNDVFAIGQGGANSIGEVNFSGTTISAANAITPPTGTDWSQVHGATVIDDTMLYGALDGGGNGELYSRTFNGHVWGPAVLVDPYNDPVWSNVKTGSGQTYRGKDASFYAEIPTLTSMFYWNGRLYYTKAGATGLYYRTFSPDSFVIGRAEGNVAGRLNFSHVAGAFETGGRLYWSNSSGQLHDMLFNGAPHGTAHTIAKAGGFTWRARGLVVSPAAPHTGNKAPTVSFRQTCVNASCSFDASASRDPEGGPLTYAWNFGDGGTASGVVVSHDFTAVGPATVTLRVSDDHGHTVVDTHNPIIDSINAITEVGTPTSFDGKVTTAAARTLAVPSGLAHNDVLVLFASASNAAARPVVTGWSAPVATQVNDDLTTSLWAQVVGTSPPSTIEVTVSAAADIDLELVAYRDVDPTAPIQRQRVRSDVAATASHATPAVRVSGAGTVALSYWVDRSSTTTSWSAPTVQPALRQLDTTIGSGTGYLSTLLADSNGSIPAVTYGGKTATTNAAGAKATSWAVVLAPAP